MKRKDLDDLGLTSEVLEKAGLPEDLPDKIFALHGKDIEGHKAKIETLEGENKSLTAQLDEAGKQIEGFKKLNPEEIQKAADEWEAKAKAAQEETAAARKESDEKVAALRFDHALEAALKEAKVKDPADVIPNLKRDKLVLNEDGSIVGLEEQLKPLRESKDYLFSDTEPAPKIVLGGNNQTISADAFEAAARKGAQLPEPKG